jgi:ribosomal 30S subunit maturation factor RimM
MENPAHLILEVSYEKGVLLIPFVDEFVESIHEQDKTISCINLDQLLED